MKLTNLKKQGISSSMQLTENHKPVGPAGLHDAHPQEEQMPEPLPAGGEADEALHESPAAFAHLGWEARHGRLLGLRLVDPQLRPHQFGRAAMVAVDDRLEKRMRVEWAEGGVSGRDGRERLERGCGDGDGDGREEGRKCRGEEHGLGGVVSFFASHCLTILKEFNTEKTLIYEKRDL